MRFALTATCILALSGCETPAPAQNAAEVMIDMGEIETDASGRCFTRDAPPTQVRIVEETVVIVPEVRDNLGRVTQPAVIRSQDGPQTFRTGNGQRFETLCPQLYTADLVSSLQRALKARGAYNGPISGAYDTPTSAAVRNFQLSSGVDSPLLQRQTVLDLGLAAVPRT